MYFSNDLFMKNNEQTSNWIVIILFSRHLSIEVCYTVQTVRRQSNPKFAMWKNIQSSGLFLDFVVGHENDQIDEGDRNKNNDENGSSTEGIVRCVTRIDTT